jgi:hypothetical protein
MYIRYIIFGSPVARYAKHVGLFGKSGVLWQVAALPLAVKA